MSPVTRATFKFLSLAILQIKVLQFYPLLENLFIYTIFIVSVLQFFHIIFFQQNVHRSHVQNCSSLVFVWEKIFCVYSSFTFSFIQILQFHMYNLFRSVLPQCFIFHTQLVSIVQFVYIDLPQCYPSHVLLLSFYLQQSYKLRLYSFTPLENLFIYTILIVSDLQFFYIIFFQQNVHRSHVQNCSSFVFVGGTNLLGTVLFTFSLDRFYSSTCTIYLYRFYHNVLSFTHTILYVLFSNFTEKIFAHLLYSLTLSQIQFFSTILLFHIFLPQCLSVTRAIIKFSSFVFFIEINSH